MSIRQVGSWAPALATPHARQVASAVVRARDVLRIYGGREIEAVRRSVEAERMPIPSLQRRLQIRRAPFSAPDQLQATHHRPHLMMEEGTGGDVKQDGLALTPDIEPIQRLHRALRLDRTSPRLELQSPMRNS